MKIDNWKEFKVGELFDIKPTKAYKLNNVYLLDGGDTPVLANSAYNNGIGGYSTLEPTEKGNIITFSDTVDANTIFYQEGDFIGYAHVQGMFPKHIYQNKWNRYCLKFFVSIFRETALLKGYNYGNKFRRDAAAKMTLFLPATPSGEPDWEYMENYMREMEAIAKERLQKLEELRRQKKRKIDVSGWGKFKVGELFDVAISKSMNKTFLNFVEDGEIEYIGRTSINNGVQGKMNICDNIEPNPKNVFSLAQIGENVCLFRKMPWYSSQNIFILAPKKEDLLRAEKYISTIITKTMDSVYGNDAYSSYPTLKTLKKVTILLPATPAGEPDWEYMENYMREMEMKTKVRLDKLKLEFS